METPDRVVSMNLCTDQLLLILADPGQIASLSYMAADPANSAMPAAAAPYPANHGRAEEIFLFRPDLVLASTWSSPGTLSMLDRLGLRVEAFPAGVTMAELRDNIRRMGTLLGQEARAEAVLAAFDARLSAITARIAGPNPRAALYGPGGYASGSRTLEGQVLEVAGFDNVAGEFGLDWGGTLPLEELVMAAPDVMIGTERAAGSGRATEILNHPALAGLRRAAPVRHQDLICATPAVLDALAALVDLRAEMEAGQ